MAALVDRGEQAGCLDLSEVDELAQTLELEEEDIPADLVPATQAAGVLHEDPELDYGVNMRVVCAVAGLTWTVQDLRSTPLLIANLRRNA